MATSLRSCPTRYIIGLLVAHLRAGVIATKPEWEYVSEQFALGRYQLLPAEGIDASM